MVGALIATDKLAHLQEVNEVFNIHVDAHPFIINSRHIDKHVVTDNFPGTGEHGRGV